MTFKQFIYVAGGAGISFTAFSILPKLIAFIFIAVFMGLGLALAFYRVNDKPFIEVMESSFKYFLSDKLYIWKKEPKKKKIKKQEKTEVGPQLDALKLSDSKLKELSWSLDVQDYDK